MRYCQVILLVVLTGCHHIHWPHSRPGHDPSKVDPFYTDMGDWDDSRIPLLKPYELIRLNGQKKWTMNIRGIPGEVDHVREVAVVDSVILIHSGPTQLMDLGETEVKEAWFIVRPKDSLEKGFGRREEFERYLTGFGLSGYRFVEPDGVYAEFGKEGKIDWDKYRK